MKINDLLKSKDNILLIVNAADLKEAFLEWAKELQEKAKDAEPEKWLTVPEVKIMFGISDQTLWRWQKAGYLVPFKVGRKRHYKYSDVKKILNGVGTNKL